ncbi:hypothetical protein PMAYCL1PPCAC_33143, partial [Pristionchus mayeri]
QQQGLPTSPAIKRPRPSSIIPTESLEMLPPRMSSPRRVPIAPPAKETFLPPKAAQRYPSPVLQVAASPAPTTALPANETFLPPRSDQRCSPPTRPEAMSSETNASFQAEVQSMPPIKGTETVRDAAKAFRGKSLSTIGSTFSVLKKQATQLQMQTQAPSRSVAVRLAPISGDGEPESPLLGVRRSSFQGGNSVKIAVQQVRRTNTQAFGKAIAVRPNSAEKKFPETKMRNQARPLYSPNNNNNNKSIDNYNYKNGILDDYRTASPVGSRSS